MNEEQVTISAERLKMLEGIEQESINRESGYWRRIAAEELAKKDEEIARLHTALRVTLRLPAIENLVRMLVGCVLETDANKMDVRMALDELDCLDD